MTAEATKHISIRLAWHDSGWNGCICRDPKANTYCVGQYSFPGDQITRERDLGWEQPLAGRPCGNLDGVPPCVYSINAFGEQELEAYGPPPTWFRDGTEVKKWKMPPYTVATWPYEEVYKEEVLNPPGTVPKYNPVRRREAVNKYFSHVAPDRSLVFYYANYSNPFSENDQHVYVIVGVSRIKAVGEELTWVNQSAKMEERYGPNVWLRNITSHYPDQGLRLPYHAYMDRPEILERIVFVPENPRHFKYATRHISDDGALGLIERLSEIVGILQEIGDTSENWQARQAWLASVMAELWHNRGLYPGLLCVLDYLGFSEAIPYTIEQISAQGEQEIKDRAFRLSFRAMSMPFPGLELDAQACQQASQDMEAAGTGTARACRVTCYHALTCRPTRSAASSTSRENASIYASHKEIAENPYILCEQYVGSGPDDQITFSQIDHGMFPSPDLGAAPELDPDDWQRLRALCVEQLQRASQHTFLPADQVLHGLNHKLSFLPEWKRAQFTQRYLEVDEDETERRTHLSATKATSYTSIARRSLKTSALVERSLEGSVESA